MDCSVFEQILLWSFIIGLGVSNFSHWRMEKNANLDDYSGPKWKLWLLGDIALPRAILNSIGKRWRVISILFFLITIVSSITIGVLNYNGSVCFGLNT